MSDIDDFLINRENSIGNSKEIYVRGERVSKIMEEDIKMLKELNVGDDLEFKQAIKNILAYIERLEEENSMLRKVNKIIDSVTTEDIERTLFEAGEDLKNNYISKQLIKDKIEKLKDEPLKINQNNKFYYETDAYNKIVTQVLQELLDTGNRHNEEEL